MQGTYNSARNFRVPCNWKSWNDVRGEMKRRNLNNDYHRALISSRHRKLSHNTGTAYVYAHFSKRFEKKILVLLIYVKGKMTLYRHGQDKM